MIAITGGTVNTITNGVIERGTLLIENGKISAVGADHTGKRRGNRRFRLLRHAGTH